MSKPAVFLDRDGTVCREVGYVNHPSRLHLADGAGAALCALREAGFRLFVVTNQAGVARGRFPFSVLEETNRRLERLLLREGAPLEGVYACVHHADVGPPGLRLRCECRKPGPGLLLRAAAEHDIDLASSVMVGDTFADVGAGRSAGARHTVLLRTGYGRGDILRNAHRAEPWPDHIADDLPAAVRWIIAGTSPGDAT